MSLLENVEQMRFMQNTPEMEERRQKELQQSRDTAMLLKIYNKNEALYDQLYPKRAFEIRNDIPIDPTYGQSRYDRQANSIIQFQNLNDLRANNQPTVSKIANGVIKTAGMAAITGGHLINFAASLVPAFNKNGTFAPIGQTPESWDTVLGKNNTHYNRWLLTSMNSTLGRYLNEVEQTMEKVLPNYRTYHEQETLWLRRAVPFGGYAANFWFDDILKNFGFSLGSLAAAKLALIPLRGMYKLGAAGGRLLQSTSKSMTSAEKQILRSRMRKLYGGLGKQTSTEELMNLLASKGNLTETATKEVEEILARRKNLGLFSEINGSIMGAVGEAQYEAAQTMREFVEEQTGLLDKWFNANDSYIQEMYKNYCASNPDDPITFDEYKQNIYNDAVDEIVEKGYHVAHCVFGWETALLSLSNFSTFRRFFNGGYDSHLIKNVAHASDKNKSFVNDGWLKRVIKPVVNAEGKTTSLTTNKTAINLAKLNAVRSMFVEGGEEMGQRFITSYNKASKSDELNQYFTDHYNSILNKNYNWSVKDKIRAGAYAFKNTFLNSEGWFEGFSGLVLGLFGGLGIHRTNLGTAQALSQQETKDENTNKALSLLKKLKMPFKVSWDSGTFKELKDIHNTEKLLNEALNKANSILSNPTERKRFEQEVLKIAYRKKMADALNIGSRSNFKDAELDELLSTIYTFEMLGQSDVLNDIFKSIGQTSEDDIADWFASNKDSLKEEDQKLTPEEFVKRIQKEVESVQKTTEEYKAQRKIVDEFLGATTSEEHRHLLASIAVQANEKFNRIIEMIDDLKNTSEVFDSVVSPNKTRDLVKTLHSLNNLGNGNIKMFQTIIDDVLTAQKEIIDDKSLSDKQKDEKFNERVNNIIKKQLLLLSMEDNKITRDVVQKVWDIVDNALQHFDLAEEYRHLMSSPEIMFQTEKILREAAENEANTANQATPEDQKDKANKLLKDLQFKTIRNKFDSLRNKAAFTGSPEENTINQLIDNLLDENNKDLTGAIEQLKAHLKFIVDNYDKNQQTYKDAVEMWELVRNLEHSLPKDTIDIARQQTIDTAMNKIEEIINRDPKFVENNLNKLNARFDKNRGAFITTMYETVVNEKPFAIELVQDCIRNEHALVVRFGDVSWSHVFGYTFRSKYEALVPTDSTKDFEQRNLKQLGINTGVLTKNIIDALSTLVTTEELTALTDEINNKFIRRVDDRFVNFIKGMAFFPLESFHSDYIKYEQRGSKKSLNDPDVIIPGSPKEEIDAANKIIQDITDAVRDLQTNLGNNSTEAVSSTESESSEKTEGNNETVNTNESEPSLDDILGGVPADQIPEEFGGTAKDTPEEPVEGSGTESNNEVQPSNEEEVNPETGEISETKPVVEGRITSPETAVGATINPEGLHPNNDGGLTPMLQFDAEKKNTSDDSIRTAKTNYVRTQVQKDRNLTTRAGLLARLKDNCAKLMEEFGIFDYLNKNGVPKGKTVIFTRPTQLDGLAEEEREEFRNNVLEAYVEYKDANENTVRYRIGYVTCDYSDYDNIVNSGQNSNGEFRLRGKTGVTYEEFDNSENKEGKTTNFRGTVVECSKSDDLQTFHVNPIPLTTIQKQTSNRRTYQVAFVTGDERKKNVNFAFNDSEHNGVNQAIRSHLSNNQYSSLFKVGNVLLITSRTGDCSENTIACYTIRAAGLQEWSRERDSEILNAFANLFQHNNENGLLRSLVLEAAENYRNEKEKTGQEASRSIWNKVNRMLEDNFLCYYRSHDNEGKVVDDKVVSMFQIKTSLKGDKVWLSTKHREGNKVEANLGDEILIWSVGEGGEVTHQATNEEIIDFLIGNGKYRNRPPVRSVTSRVLNSDINTNQDNIAVGLDGKTQFNVIDLLNSGGVVAYSELIPYNVTAGFILDGAYEREQEEPKEVKVENISEKIEEDQPEEEQEIEVEKIETEPNSNRYSLSKVYEKAGLTSDEQALINKIDDEIPNESDLLTDTIKNGNPYTVQNIQDVTADDSLAKKYKPIYEKIKLVFKSDETRSQCLLK